MNLENAKNLPNKKNFKSQLVLKAYLFRSYVRAFGNNKSKIEILVDLVSLFIFLIPSRNFLSSQFHFLRRNQYSFKAATNDRRYFHPMLYGSVLS